LDIHFNEINGHIRVADSEAFLTPELKSRILAELMMEIDLRDRQKRRLASDTQLRRSAIEPPEEVA
jgi:hypothetical protein